MRRFSFDRNLNPYIAILVVTVFGSVMTLLISSALSAHDLLTEDRSLIEAELGN
ncbi:hypothetical protein L0Y34_00540 [Candidatus Parcubacteria bacterium]|nr:hypothetical protein [Candidatus Parcubacteria bacterium]